MSDTPETDEAQFGTGRVSVDFCRRLERERDALREENRKLREELAKERAYFRELAKHHNKHCTCMEIY